MTSPLQRLTTALGRSDRVERELGAGERVATARRSLRHIQSDIFNGMNPTRLIRDAAGLTQQELAERAETSQATIAAYEGGHKSPTWRTVERLAQAADVELVVQCVPPLTREDRRSLALHQAIVERLEQDPEAVLARARASVLRMHTVHPAARPLLDEWRLFLRRPLASLIAVLLDPSQRGRDLRQVTPFTGVLSARERANVYRRFGEAWRERVATTQEAS